MTEKLEPATSDTDVALRSLTLPHIPQKIHTLLTLGVSILAKSLVLKARKCVPHVFDSHRPLHSQATPGNAGRQGSGQHVDLMGIGNGSRFGTSLVC
jgi:hypothetical protein